MNTPEYKKLSKERTKLLDKYENNNLDIIFYTKEFEDWEKERKEKPMAFKIYYNKKRSYETKLDKLNETKRRIEFDISKVEEKIKKYVGCELCCQDGQPLYREIGEIYACEDIYIPCPGCTKGNITDASDEEK